MDKKCTISNTLYKMNTNNCTMNEDPFISLDIKEVTKYTSTIFNIYIENWWVRNFHI